MPSKALFLLPILFLIMVKTHAMTPQDDIKEQVRQFALNEVESVMSNFDEVQVDMAYLDRRIKLQTCENPVNIEKRYGQVNQGRITVEISCDSPAYWKIRTPVRIQIFKDIIVATDLLRKEHLIQADDIIMKRQDITHAAKGYYELPEEIIGKVVYRTIRQGTIIKPSMIKEPTLIERGDIVNIISQGKGITVRTKGIALKEGIKGELITVKNPTSNRTIEAVVTSKGTVSVSL